MNKILTMTLIAIGLCFTGCKHLDERVSIFPQGQYSEADGKFVQSIITYKF